MSWLPPDSPNFHRLALSCSSEASSNNGQNTCRFMLLFIHFYQHVIPGRKCKENERPKSRNFAFFSQASPTANKTFKIKKRIISQGFWVQIITVRRSGSFEGTQALRPCVGIRFCDATTGWYVNHEILLPSECESGGCYTTFKTKKSAMRLAITENKVSSRYPTGVQSMSFPRRCYTAIIFGVSPSKWDTFGSFWRLSVSLSLLHATSLMHVIYLSEKQ